MDWDGVAKDWQKLKKNARKKWDDLSDTEIDAIEGNPDKLAGKLQERYGWTADEAAGEVDRFLQQMSGTHGSGPGPDD